MKIRIAGIVPESVVDGDGLRYVIFTQGCPHRCNGCHNPETWDIHGGRDVEVDDLIREFSSDPLISGITLSGGEPFSHSWDCLSLARAAHDRGLTVWCYTGWTIEQLSASKLQSVEMLLKEIDVLVDGRFEIESRSYDLRFRGSTNQRIIHLDHGVITKIEREGKS